VENCRRVTWASILPASRWPLRRLPPREILRPRVWLSRPRRSLLPLPVFPPQIRRVVGRPVRRPVLLPVPLHWDREASFRWISWRSMPSSRRWIPAVEIEPRPLDCWESVSAPCATSCVNTESPPVDPMPDPTRAMLVPKILRVIQQGLPTESFLILLNPS